MARSARARRGSSVSAGAPCFRITAVRWQEAWHEGGGRLRVGETTAFAAGVASLPVGHVIVRAWQPGGAPFRTSTAVEAYEVTAGTLRDATARAALDAAAPALLALSSAAALGAPLLLAALLERP